MASEKGEVNGWQCDKCGEATYAIHVDDGVTPFYLGCRATEDCKGMAKSMFYPSGPVPDYVLAAITFEWYMPDDEERTGIVDSAVLEHVAKGGLLLRELTDAGREEIKSHLG